MARSSRRLGALDPTGVVNLLLAAAGGAFIAASFLRFSLWPLAWVSFVPILVAIARSRSYGEAARVGVVAGVATNVPAFYWLVHTIHVFGGFPIGVAILFYAVLSLYAALQFVVLSLAMRRTAFGPAALAPALIWVSLEFLYPSLFPWRMANTQFPVLWLIQVGELTGPFGLSFVMLWMSAAIALRVRLGVRSARSALVGASAAVAAVLLFGVVRLPQTENRIAEGRPIDIGVVQGNLSIEEKGDVRYLESNLATYRRLTRALPAELQVVIWPETVISEPLPRTMNALPPGATTTLGIRQALLTGAVTYAGSPESPSFYNSVVLVGPSGEILGLSDKIILMPFGEYVPLGSVFPALKRFSPMTGDFQAGDHVHVLEVPGAGRFAPLNCYEDLVASIARRAVRDDGAEVLFTVANDAWFGATAAPFQHEALALWRAVENRRFLIRVTNTGVTDIIDAAGRIQRRLPVFEPVSTIAEVRLLRTATFYQRFGDVFGWVAVAGALLVVAVGGRSRD